MKSNLQNASCSIFRLGYLAPGPIKGNFIKFLADCGTDMKFGFQGQIDTLKKIRCGHR